jgi:hypothetical protein
MQHVNNLSLFNVQNNSHYFFLLSLEERNRRGTFGKVGFYESSSKIFCLFSKI